MLTPEAKIADLLDQVSSAMRVAVETQIPESRLSRFEAMVMSHLLYVRRLAEPATIKHLGAYVDMGRDQTLETLERLVRRGYVVKSGSEPVVWALTPEGQRVLMPVFEASESVVAEATKGIGPEELQGLTRSLRVMVKNARDLGRP